VGRSERVERLENVIGSGITHQRYFPPAISFLKRKATFEVIVDVGCGDGHFLSAVLRSIPDKKVVGIDISNVSTEAAYKNLVDQYPEQDVKMVCSDACDVEKWSGAIGCVGGTEKVVICLWFLLHEVSRNRPGNIIEFLNKVHEQFSDSLIVIGEVVRQSDAILSKNSRSSIMPEYLFFHELSGQGILSWDQYQEILDNVPYELVFERLFDEVLDDEGNRVPSAFVWCLTPE
jgi:SAM-dependent methyltransferase